MGAAVKSITVLLLLFSLGLHWSLLQTVAWAGMIASYSRDASLVEAISRTFDGEHPCTLCETIEHGREAEKQEQQQKHRPETKYDLGVLCQTPTFLFPAVREPFPSADAWATPRAEEPPAPHPRPASAGIPA